MAAKKKPKPPANKPDGEAKLTRFQSFASVRMCRRDIRRAPYNPRKITEENRKKLQANLDSDHGGVGLLGPVTWNKTTGNLVGGHQRLAILDALEDSDNYLLDVAVVELTEAQEVEQNIALNSDRLGGEWDMQLLADALKTPSLNLAATGFSVADIQLSFTDPQLATLFAPNEPTKALLNEVESMQADGKKPRAASSGAGGADGSGEGSSSEREGPKEREVMKRTRGENDENYREDDTEFHVTVFFNDRAEREFFMTSMGEEPDARYLDGAKLWSRLGITPPKRAAPPPKSPPPKRGRKAQSK